MWHFDENNSYFYSDVINTVKNKKMNKVIELAPATKEHPAQIQLVTEDVPIGTWKTIKISSKLPKTTVDEMLVKIDKLIKAVQIAREEANAVEVEKSDIGSKIMDYLRV